MSKKTRYSPKPIRVPLYEPALANMDKLEVAMVNRMVRPEFTVDDLVTWLYPPEVVKVALEAAEYIQSTYMDPTVLVDVGGVPRVRVTFCAPRYATPKEKFSRIQDTAQACHIHAVLNEVCTIVAQCDVVRDVVTCFNKYDVKPRVAASLFPQLGALLPLEHVFHRVVPCRSPAGTAWTGPLIDREKIRQAVNIVATGLLCNPDSVQPDRNIVKVAPIRENRGERWLGIL